MSGGFGTHSSRCTTSFQLRGQVRSLCHKLQHLPLIFQESSFCALAFCAFANRQGTNLCLIWERICVWSEIYYWKVGCGGTTARNVLRTGLKACVPWCQGRHSSSKCTAEVQSTLQPCEKLGCEQPGGRKCRDECVWWDVCVLKHVGSAGLLQRSGYFTPVITLSSWRIHGPESRWISLKCK